MKRILSLSPTTNGEAEIIKQHMKTLLAHNAFKQAQSLMHRFSKEPRYCSSAHSNRLNFNNLQWDLAVLERSFPHSLGPQLVKMWENGLDGTVKIMILKGDTENAFKLAMQQEPKLMYPLIQKIGSAYIELRQILHLESLIDLLGEKEDPLAQITQCNIIKELIQKRLQEGTLEEPLIWFSRFQKLEAQAGKSPKTVVREFTKELIDTFLVYTGCPSKHFAEVLSFIESILGTVEEENRRDLLEEVKEIFKTSALKCPSTSKYQEGFGSALELIDALLASSQ